VTEAWEALGGLLLIFLLPGFGVTRALFPERRVFRPLSWKNLLEELTSSIVLSVAITILVGFAWLGTSVGFQSNWSDPLVEITLLGITVLAMAVAALRGAFSREPPMAPSLEPQGGHSDPMVVIRRLDQLRREERSLQHRIRVAGSNAPESGPLVQELERVRSEVARLRVEREEEYALS
jgi:hypothetical protein